MKLTQKTGFEPLGDGPIFLGGKLVYLAKRGERFNLPPGRYSHNLMLVPLADPVFYELPKLPEKERDYVREPEKENFELRKNPSKASINPKTGHMIFDPGLLDYPKYVFDFVVFHELGHYHYGTEEKCDIFAVRQMLEKGWNPSNVAAALELVNNKFRKEPTKSFLQIFER
jgi:hypothetical protein